MTPADLDQMVAKYWGHNRPDGASRKVRIVLRFDPADVYRLDALRRHRWPKSSRSAIVRAFVMAGLDMATPKPEGEP